MVDPKMKEAFEEIERLSQNPATRRLADFREQELMDILQREADAFEKGVAQGKEIVREIIRLKADGITPENIAEYVKFPIEKVLDIIKALEQ